MPSLSLPDNQDALIEQVASANPHTVVVLETGTAVTMPWIDKVAGRSRGLVRGQLRTPGVGGRTCGGRQSFRKASAYVHQE